jgi:hypothetical protein
MREIRFLFCVLLLATIQMGAQVNSGATSESLRVQYTGRLFGYYRIEPGENANDNLPPVNKFLIMRRNFGDQQNAPLLLGMGDNFAPEMGASLQQQHLETDCALAAGSQVPESLYKTSDRYARRAECDNVVNFLLQAGYRAIVPGREDFAYSAAWLHRISLLIRQTHSSHNKDTKLAMLAANARLGLAKKCPLLFNDNLSGRDGEMCTQDDLPDRLDWLERLDRVSVGKGIRGQVEKAAERTFGSYTLLGNEARAMDSMLPQRPEWRPLRNVLAELYQNDYKLSNLKPPARATDPGYQGQLRHITDVMQVLVCTLKNKSAATVCKPATPAKSAPDFEASIKDLAGKCAEINSLLHAQGLPIPALLWDNDICIFGEAMLREHERILKASVSSQATKVSASPLSPDEIDAGKQALLRGIADEQNDIGYTEATVLEDGKPKSVLIIGVIGQQTMKAISSTNATICLQKPDGNSEPMSESIVSCRNSGALQGKVKIIDPVRTTRAILRATEVVHGKKYDYRILMAQMSKTEATELASRLDFCSGETLPGVETLCGAAPVPRVIIPQIDLVLSEAQSGHVSSNFEIQYGLNGLRWSNIPVLTPIPAYDIVAQNLVRPDTTAFLTAAGPSLRTVCNAASDGSAWSCKPLADRSVWPPFEINHSALDLLMSAVEHANTAAQFSIPAGVLGVPNPLRADNCKPDSAFLAGCEISVTQFLLQNMQETGHTDVAILQRRDIFLGKLPDKYDDYLVCEPLASIDRTRCELRMALDRVLWKGDYAEVAMLPGKDVASLMAAASNQNSLEQTLEQTDISGQWLVTFGIVTSPALNLGRSQPNANEFFVTHDENCNDAQERAHPSAGGSALYCVNGVPLLADHSYSIATTDYLDQTFVLPKQPTDYYSLGRDFLTKAIANAIFHMGSIAPQGNSAQTRTNDQPHGLVKIADIMFHPDRPERQNDTAKMELNHQQRGLFQVDIGKIFAGYSFRAAPKGDNFIASTFQGVTDTRATSPSQSELDVEAKERGLWRTKYFNYGIQSDAAYDRSVQGNLTGLPVNAAYQLNNLSVGGFAEFKIPLGKSNPQSAPAGTLKAVLAPFQYQRQINGSYLIFAHTDKTPGQQILHLAPVNGFSHRAGMRWEEVTSGKWFRGDRGTYYEVGAQLSLSNDILAAVTLNTPGTIGKTCTANSTQTISNCFKQASIPVTANTSVSALPATLHSPGLYWDVHFQKALVPLADKSGPGISLQIDTKGDYFIPRGSPKTLSTQTLYDLPLSVALAFPIFRNFSVGPNYQVFFYGNQVASQHLIVNSFSLSGRWFLDRDAAVRFRRQVIFKGPASADETKTARMK